jgi:hypothetical protein
MEMGVASEGIIKGTGILSGEGVVKRRYAASSVLRRLVFPAELDIKCGPEDFNFRTVKK